MHARQLLTFFGDAPAGAQIIGKDAVSYQDDLILNPSPAVAEIAIGHLEKRRSWDLGTFLHHGGIGARRWRLVL